jgi:hypothetical protein
LALALRAWAQFAKGYPCPSSDRYWLVWLAGSLADCH